jgi:hypothetical protein
MFEQLTNLNAEIKTEIDTNNAQILTLQKEVTALTNLKSTNNKSIKAFKTILGE